MDIAPVHARTPRPTRPFLRRMTGFRKWTSLDFQDIQLPKLN